MTGDWQPVVRRVRAKYPKLAQLDADFLSALVSGNHGVAPRKTSAAIAGNTSLAAAYLPVPRASAAGSSPSRTRSSSGSKSAVSPWAVVWILVILGRVVASLNSHSSNNYYVPPPNTSNFPNSYAPPNTSNSRVNDQALQRIRDAIRDRENTRGGNSTPWPPGGSNPTPWAPGGSNPRNPFQGADEDAKHGKPLVNGFPSWCPPPPSSPTGGDSAVPSFPEKAEKE